MFGLKIDKEKCSKCGACVRECPFSLLQEEEGEVPVVVEGAEDVCFRCQHCYTVCPTGALSIFGLDPEVDSVRVTKEILPTAESMKNLARSRRTVRKYQPKSISQETIDSILHATANAPTAANSCALKFDVVSGHDRLKDLSARIMDSLVEYRTHKEFPPAQVYLDHIIARWKDNRVDPLFYGAAHVLIVSSQVDNPMSSIIDVSIALSYFELIAQAEGLGTTWNGMLGMALEVLPEIKNELLTFGAGDFYCMVFGAPAVKFSRTSVRDNSAAIRYVK